MGIVIHGVQRYAADDQNFSVILSLGNVCSMPVFWCVGNKGIRGAGAAATTLADHLSTRVFKSKRPHDQMLHRKTASKAGVSLEPSASHAVPLFGIGTELSSFFMLAKRPAQRATQLSTVRCRTEDFANSDTKFVTDLYRLASRNR